MKRLHYLIGSTTLPVFACWAPGNTFFPLFLNLPARANAIPFPKSLLEDLANTWTDAAGTASLCEDQLCHRSCTVCVCRTAPLHGHSIGVLGEQQNRD